MFRSYSVHYDEWYRRANRRITVVTLFVVLFVVGAPAAHFWQEARASRLERTLFDALNRQDARLVDQLLRDGADPNARRAGPRRAMSERLSVSSAANMYEPTPLEASLVTYSVQVSGFNRYQTSRINDHPNPQIVRSLLQAGAAVNTADRMYEPPVVMALRSGSIEVLDLLLHHGAVMPNGKDNMNNPLLVAAHSCKVSMIKYLLDRGENAAVVDPWGSTALHQVVWSFRPEMAECARLLIAHHCPVNAKNRAGKTALSITQQWTIRLTSEQTKSVARLIPVLKQAGAK